MAAEKARIATAALSDVPDEGVILLDAGTTTGALAEMLPVDRELTVVTNDLPIAMGLAAKANITVWTLGGRVRSRTLSLVETWALRALDEVVVDVAFMATNGITVDDGLTTPDQAESAVKRAMVRAARRSVLLADHTKVGRSFFARFGRVQEIDKLITDSGLDEVAARRLRDAGLEVVAA
jgi:DeoR family fructose operon transcriptional repressor